MDTNKDIFDQIKDKGQNLELYVKPQLWDRMEDRLDNAPIQKKRHLNPFLRMAASVCLIVGLAAVASLFIFQNKSILAGHDNFQIEELKDNSLATAKFKQQQADRTIYREKLREIYGDGERRSTFK